MSWWLLWESAHRENIKELIHHVNSIIITSYHVLDTNLSGASHSRNLRWFFRIKGDHWHWPTKLPFAYFKCFKYAIIMNYPYHPSSGVQSFWRTAMMLQTPQTWSNSPHRTKSAETGTQAWWKGRGVAWPARNGKMVNFQHSCDYMWLLYAIVRRKRWTNKFGVYYGILYSQTKISSVSTCLWSSTPALYALNCDGHEKQEKGKLVYGQRWEQPARFPNSNLAMRWRNFLMPIWFAFLGAPQKKTRRFMSFMSLKVHVWTV